VTGRAGRRQTADGDGRMDAVEADGRTSSVRRTQRGGATSTLVQGRRGDRARIRWVTGASDGDNAA